MQIEISGQPCIEDYLHAQFLHLRNWKSLVVLGAALAVIIWLCIQAYPRQGLWAFLPLGVFPVLLGVSFIILRGRIVKVWKQEPLAQEPVTGTVTAAELRLRGQSWKSTKAFRDFTRYQMGSDLIVLYEGRRAMRILPRRYFHSEADWKTFCELVRRSVGAGAGA